MSLFWGFGILGTIVGLLWLLGTDTNQPDFIIALVLFVAGLIALCAKCSITLYSWLKSVFSLPPPMRELSTEPENKHEKISSPSVSIPKMKNISNPSRVVFPDAVVEPSKQVNTQTSPVPLFCTNCGKPIVHDARFCPSCGTAVHNDKALTSIGTPTPNKPIAGIIVALVLAAISLLYSTFNNPYFTEPTGALATMYILFPGLWELTAISSGWWMLGETVIMIGALMSLAGHQYGNRTVRISSWFLIVSMTIFGFLMILLIISSPTWSEIESPVKAGLLGGAIGGAIGGIAPLFLILFLFRKKRWG